MVQKTPKMATPKGCKNPLNRRIFDPVLFGDARINEMLLTDAEVKIKDEFWLNQV